MQADTLTLEWSGGTVMLIRELVYSFKSTDNIRQYPEEWDFSEVCASSVVGIFVDDCPIAVVGADGGGTGVHANSARLIGNRLYLAIGDQIVCLSLAPFAFNRAVRADHATCFGLHYSHEHDALICHGELAISRWSRDLQRAWESSGRDIFTGALVLGPSCIEVSDFDQWIYHFAYDDGREIRPSHKAI